MHYFNAATNCKSHRLQSSCCNNLFSLLRDLKHLSLIDISVQFMATYSKLSLKPSHFLWLGTIGQPTIQSDLKIHPQNHNGQACVGRQCHNDDDGFETTVMQRLSNQEATFFEDRVQKLAQ